MSNKRKFAQVEEADDSDCSGITCESDCSDDTESEMSEAHPSDIDFIDDNSQEDERTTSSSEEEFQETSKEPLPPRKAKVQASEFIDTYVQLCKQNQRSSSSRKSQS